MAKRITAIPATLNRFTSAPIYAAEKKKVAGYARVSTDLEEQQSSYEAQMDYYRTYITSRNDWEFVGMYSDEGITATNTLHRDGFNRMIEDALAGKIDLIITKSISRFARNTVDSLTTVRKLKENGVEIFFEKENIWTLDSKGELLITIMSSLAQEESRSISENTTWGKRKSFADGKASVTYSHFLGYDKGFVINKEEAETVMLIYKLFLSGLSLYAITKELKSRGLKTPCGKDTWPVSTIKSILMNEKYKGCALLQKGYTVDFLQKKRKKNEGEIPQYYVEEHHKPIIAPSTFELVQSELKKRGGKGTYYSGISVFTSRIKCGECGGWYGIKVWHSTDKYRRIIYRCNQKYRRQQKCGTPHLTEEDIKRLFLQALNQMIGEKEEVIANLGKLGQLVSDTSTLDEEKKQLDQEITILEEELRRLIAENAHVDQEQDEYNQKYNAAYDRYDTKRTRREEIKAKKREKTVLSERIRIFIANLMTIDGEQTVFDEELWGGIVDHVTVYTKDRIVFTFVGGIDVVVGE